MLCSGSVCLAFINWFPDTPTRFVRVVPTAYSGAVSMRVALLANCVTCADEYEDRGAEACDTNDAHEIAVGTGMTFAACKAACDANDACVGMYGGLRAGAPAAVVHDGACFLSSSSEDGAVHRWEVKTGASMVMREHAAPVCAMSELTVP